MAAFYAFYPPSGGGSSNASVGTNGATAPTSSTEVAGINPSGNLQPLQTDASGALITTPATGSVGHVIVDSSALSTGASTAALQTTGNSVLGSILLDLTNGTQITQVTGTIPLPTGAATAAKQDTGNVSLASIDGKTPALVGGAVPVTGPLTDTQLRATAVPVSLTSTTITGSVAVTGPLTDTQLRATPVPVSGTVSTGGLTDTQLRATPVPVSLTSTTITGSVAVTGTVTANAGTNLNTSALALETTQSAISGKLPATLGQKTMAASMAVVIASDQSTISASLPGKTVATAPVYTVYSSTPVTTAAYVQLVASTTAAVTHLSIFDSSGQAFIIATGAAASEVVKLYVPPGGGEFDLAIPISTRISIKMLTANTTGSGYNLLNMLT